jgi:hypothetical protein
MKRVIAVELLVVLVVMGMTTRIALAGPPPPQRPADVPNKLTVDLGPNGPVDAGSATILGKALEPLAPGTGVIKTLVMLR